MTYQEHAILATNTLNIMAEKMVKTEKMKALAVKAVIYALLAIAVAIETHGMGDR